MLARLAVCMARHRRRVFAVWLIGLTAGLLGLPHLLGSLQAPPIEVSGSESQRVGQILAEGLPTLGREQMIVVLRSEGRRTTDPAFRAAIDAGKSALAREDGVSGVLLLPVAGDPDRVLPLGSALEPLRPLMRDEHSAYLLVGVSGDDRQRQERSPVLQDVLDRTVREASGGEVHAYLVGVSVYGEAIQKVEIADLMRIELVAVPLAILVLWWGLRRPVAAVVPVVIAGAGVVATTGMFSMLTGVFTVDGMLLVGVSALGLGIGIDYALFVMNRYREELAAGAEPEDAVATAAATTGRTVLYSGLILVLAALSLFMVRWHVFAQTGIGALAVVSITLLASVTLLPAVLISLTRWLEWRPRWARATRADVASSGRLARWAEHLMRHPWPYAVAVTAGLLLAAIPTTDLAMGINLERRALASTPYLTGFAVAEGELVGATGPVAVLLVRPADTPEPDSAALQAALRADPDVTAVAVLDNGEDLTGMVVLARHPIDSPAVLPLVERIRTEIIPANSPPGVTPMVGGPGAHVADIVAESSRKLWWVVGCVLAMMCAALMVILRSVLLPLKAIAMSLLATGAAYGLTVLVFQRANDSGVIWPQVPLIMFVLLFGLSTDYELFLVRRIQEEYLRTGDNRRSVVIGLQSTARPISLAAAILAVGYGSLLVSRIVGLQEFGFAIATALIIDATLIRLVLVPALMQIMGRWNWWFPRLPWVTRDRPSADRDSTRQPQIEQLSRT
ncbi:RND superfamily putative drug exporter [Nocardia tenerifensis]|uniref:RND superfamily putative drug exporter n=2 Tax=Nocardia tenerifensis TaxID=228006 RepID=A0A318K977_9NOCA|nr:RND superfamily putative drug exporter [Nocardia tenerifensis]